MSLVTLAVELEVEHVYGITILALLHEVDDSCFVIVLMAKGKSVNDLMAVVVILLLSSFLKDWLQVGR